MRRGYLIALASSTALDRADLGAPPEASITAPPLRLHAPPLRPRAGVTTSQPLGPPIAAPTGAGRARPRRRRAARPEPVHDDAFS